MATVTIQVTVKGDCPEQTRDAITDIELMASAIILADLYNSWPFEKITYRQSKVRAYLLRVALLSVKPSAGQVFSRPKYHQWTENRVESYAKYTPFLVPHGDVLETRYCTFRMGVEKVNMSIPTIPAQFRFET